MATHAEWDQFTPGTEVAQAFAENIKGKTGKLAVVMTYRRTDLLASRDYGCRAKVTGRDSCHNDSAACSCTSDLSFPYQIQA